LAVVKGNRFNNKKGTRITLKNQEHLKEATPKKESIRKLK
jgi:hypothetical protein